MFRARPACLFLALTAAVGSAGTAAAQSDPGATVVTHHETIPNPVFGSSLRVAPACRYVVEPCAWEQPSTWTGAVVPGLGGRVIVDANVRIHTRTAAALAVGVYPGGTLSFSPGASTRLLTADLVVFAGGALEIGTRLQPIPPGL